LDAVFSYAHFSYLSLINSINSDSLSKLAAAHVTFFGGFSDGGRSSHIDARFFQVECYLTKGDGYDLQFLLKHL
jgi:hypothetical protein